MFRVLTIIAAIAALAVTAAPASASGSEIAVESETRAVGAKPSTQGPSAVSSHPGNREPHVPPRRLLHLLWLLHRRRDIGGREADHGRHVEHVAVRGGHAAAGRHQWDHRHPDRLRLAPRSAPAGRGETHRRCTARRNPSQSPKARARRRSRDTSLPKGPVAPKSRGRGCPGDRGGHGGVRHCATCASSSRNLPTSWRALDIAGWTKAAGSSPWRERPFRLNPAPSWPGFASNSTSAT